MFERVLLADRFTEESEVCMCIGKTLIGIQHDSISMNCKSTKYYTYISNIDVPADERIMSQETNLQSCAYIQSRILL